MKIDATCFYSSFYVYSQNCYDIDIIDEKTSVLYMFFL